MTHYHISLQHFTKKQLSNYWQNDSHVGISDFSQAMVQYNNLCKTVGNLGATLSLLPCTEGKLGSLAVVAGRLAILGRANNNPAQAAYSTIASVLAGNNILKFIEEHGTMDGRDVVRIDDTFLIAITENTNYEGASQLAFYLAEAGYDVQIIDALSKMDTFLQDHLIYVGNDTVAVSSILSKHYTVMPYKKIVLEQAKDIISNSIVINDIMVMPTGFEAEEQQLQSFGVKLMPIDLSELAKLDINLSGLCFVTTTRENAQDSYVADKALAI